MTERDLELLPLLPGIGPPSLAQAQEWLQALSRLSPVLKKRKSLGAALHFHKPSSPRYQYAKHRMTAEQRTQLSAVLKYLIARASHNKGDTEHLTDLYLCVQHARLRSHTPQERARFHANATFEAGFYGALSLVPGLGVVHIPQGILSLRETQRDYYRSEARPEYAATFNDIMNMLRRPDNLVTPAAKQKIAGMLIDDFIVNEKLITPADANRILLSLSPELRRGAEEHDNVATHRRLRSKVLTGRSTEEQRNRLIAWANRTGLASDHLRSSAAYFAHQRRQQQDIRTGPLSAHLENAFEQINAMRKEDGLPALPVPPDLSIYDQLPNADAFITLLQRAERDPGIAEKHRKKPIYNNVATILSAIFQDETQAAWVFDKCVGGTQYCINNALEYINDLAAMCANHTVLRAVEEGKMDFKEFTGTVWKQMRREVLQTYIEGQAIPELAAKNPNVGSDYGPEVAQTIKWDAKKRGQRRWRGLEFPDTITPSTANYPGKDARLKRSLKTVHQDLTQRAYKHVEAETNNPDAVKAYLDADPLWRKGVRAFAKRQSPIDSAMLDRYTANFGEFFEDEAGVVDSAGHQVTDDNLLRAIQASADLEVLYKPEGQLRIAEDGVGYRFHTDMPAHQNLYDLIVKLESSFQDAIRDIERQYARYVFDSMKNKKPRLPMDGHFTPVFTLPDAWNDIDAIKRESQIVELSHIAELNRKQARQISLLEKEIEELTLNDAFEGLPDEKVRERKAEILLAFARGELSLQSYVQRKSDPAAEDAGSIPQSIVDLREKFLELAKLKTAFALTQADLAQGRNVSTPVLDAAATAAILLLEGICATSVWDSVNNVEEELQRNARFDAQRHVPGGAARAWAEDFDPATGTSTSAYQAAIAQHVTAVRKTLEYAGLHTVNASSSGHNCLIHSVLDQIGIAGADNIRIAAEIRAEMTARLAGAGVVLPPNTSIDGDGLPVGHLVDIINERFPEIDLAVRIYAPLPDGGLVLANQGNEGGASVASRANTVAILWVGNHFEPIKAAQY